MLCSVRVPAGHNVSLTESGCMLPRSVLCPAELVQAVQSMCRRAAAEGVGVWRGGRGSVEGGAYFAFRSVLSQCVATG